MKYRNNNKVYKKTHSKILKIQVLKSSVIIIIVFEIFKNEFQNLFYQ